MLLLVFFLLFVCRSALADKNDKNEFDVCAKAIQIEKYQKIVNSRDEYSLVAICPFTTDLIICVEDVLETNSGFTVEELEVMFEGTERGRFISLLINVRRTFRELCDNNSQLNKDYRANAQCLMRVNNPDPNSLCMKTAAAVFETYEKFEDEVEDAAGNDIDKDENRCMVSAYRAACLGVEIHKECGETAFNTYMTIVKGTAVYRYEICDENQLEKAQMKFLNSLEMDIVEREFYKLALDLKKRKK